MPKLSDLRVCFLAGTLGQGGAERQLFYMLRSLRTAGAQVTLLSLTQGEHWERPISDLGIEVRYVGEYASRIARCQEITRQVKAIKPDIVHSQHFYTNLYAVAAARWCGAREVGSLRSDAFHEVNSHRFPLGQASLKMPRAVAVNSQRGMRNAIAIGARPDRIHLLPNVVDQDRFAVSQRPSNGHVNLCFVGRLAAVKRIDLLLKAIGLAKLQTSIAIEATIVGDGPERKRLEAEAAELKLLANGVTFVGTCSNPQVYYQEADLLALTSDYEGTPNVLLEAMACGLPVVATAVGGVPDVVTAGETGLLASAGNTEEIANCIVRIANDRELRQRMGASAAAFIREHHSFDSLPGHLERVYTAALT